MRYAFVLPVIGLLATFCPSVSSAQAAKVAVVRPAKVFQDLQETKDLRTKMESEGRTLKAVGDEKGARIVKLQAELQQIKRDGPGFAEKAKELRGAQIDADTWQKVTQADLESNEKNQTLVLFRKIEVAIAEVAKSKGVELVVADVAGDLPDNVEGVNKQQFTQFLSQKNVWFVAGAADITNDVLAKLDADFKAAEKK